MSSIINFILNNEGLIMLSLFILIIVLLGVVTITDWLNKRKNVKAAKELLRDSGEDIIDAFKEELINEEYSSNTEDLTSYKDVLVYENQNIPTQVTEIKYVEEDEELEKTKAQLELKTLKEELMKAELEEKKELEAKKEEKIETKEEIIDAFESSQEENAIISLEEFNKVSDRIYEANEEVQYKDEGNEPISIQELEELYQTKELKVINIEEIEKNIVEEKPIVIEEKKEEIVKPIVEETPKFKNSPIISPVFGIDVDKEKEKEEIINNLELENTANYDKLNEEIRKTNEFLNTLRELRKNLQ